MSQGDHREEDVHRLAELTQNLKGLHSPKTLIHIDNSDHNTDHNTDHSVTVERRKDLQDQLRQEVDEHIKEGRVSVEKMQERVGTIRQLKEALREEKEEKQESSEKSDHSEQDWYQVQYNRAQERRRKIKEDHGRVIQEEVEKMERELGKEQTEGTQRELLVLGRERQVLVLQMEALRTEALEAERDLETQYHRHQHELYSLREESLQVFRVFRQVSEEQRRVSEGRYRTLLLEAIQDAVYLSSQNQQLQADNKQLRKALAELKDILCVRGDLKGQRVSQ
ncbi:trichohyalin [Coregonus clupeaformis]|uniref:trichohyalin n=1 Tax=Coregonus clupeaformis TaxID=59861 RepID=UPI001BE08BD8|nr:trichohyalin [Coregonus clupeaformis]